MPFILMVIVCAFAGGLIIFALSDPRRNWTTVFGAVLVVVALLGMTGRLLQSRVSQKTKTPQSSDKKLGE
ncbi:MAG: hypothetical protein MUC92_11460 [Fimbriimonadaceae bacterium]|jgi:membrane protein implicated in regulation of membrane protease activity|nr:hypothetical protein [Fimbriimonadaceae bacterium]